MNDSSKLNVNELSKDTLDSLKETNIDFVEKFVERFVTQMERCGKFLSNDDRERLTKYVLHNADVKVTIAVKAEEEKLGDAGIYFIDAAQVQLQAFNEAVQ